MSLLILSTKTPVGDLHLVIEREGRRGKTRDIVRASGFGELGDLLARFSTDVSLADMQDAPMSHPYAKAIAAYFRGDARALEAVECKQKGSEFQQKIWKAMSKVKFGETVSYQELAERAGEPAAIRAAGSACAKNLLAPFIPCHRILKSDGSVGSYYYGSEIKEALLALEGSLK